MADNDLKKELDVLKNGLKELRGDLKNLVESGADMSGDAMSAARTTLEKEAELLISQLHEAASGAVQSGGRMMRRMESRIEDWPVGSVLTSVGVGIVLGWLGTSAFNCMFGDRE